MRNAFKWLLLVICVLCYACVAHHWLFADEWPAEIEVDAEVKQ